MKMTQAVEESIADHEEMMMNFYGRKRYKTDMRRSKKEGEQLGLAKGEQLGLAKGEQLGKESIVLNLLNMKYPLDEIVRVTGVSMTRILQIAKDNNLINV